MAAITFYCFALILSFRSGSLVSLLFSCVARVLLLRSRSLVCFSLMLLFRSRSLVSLLFSRFALVLSFLLLFGSS